MPTFVRLLCLLFASFYGVVSLRADVSVKTVSNYGGMGYKGEFTSPPSADGNPRRAIIVEWTGRPEQLVFWHEASYCPFFELSDGSGACFQFFEGNDGWAELFNQFGRMEKNSIVEVVERGPTAGSPALDLFRRQPAEWRTSLPRQPKTSIAWQTASFCGGSPINR